MTLLLGPFELVAPTGQGAMAEVWQAIHRGQAVPAAVKIVTAPIGQHEKFRTWFAHELRAVARLDHPGVVRLYDHGEIGAEVAAASGRRLPRGAPYLVMEWIEGGPLSTRAGRLPWPALRRVLLGLLDALGHAHARGVIHRDLKPDNVLLADRGPVLTDFGVAFTAERFADARSEAFAGTPNYMAPEQVTGDLRALGPWTDLYALGCLAYTLARGRPPFDGGAATEVARAQLLAPMPRLDPDLPVPDGFEAWLAHMLQKRPGERFRFAADAAVALMALPDDAPPPPGAAAVEATEADDTLVAEPVFLSTPAEIWASGPAPDGRPPFPADWRRPAPPPTPPPLLGVGRTVFGLRAPSMHGRHAERDRLWATLGAVVTGGGARAVLIEGQSGLGKTRLSQWLGRRAHELGVADVLLATHDAVESPGCGAGPMLARHLRSEALDLDRTRRQLRARLGDDLDPETTDALAAIMGSGDPYEARPGVRLSSPIEANTVIAHAIERLCRHRPLVLRLEDPYWSEESLELCDHLLTAHPHLPLLIVATLRDDAVPEDRRLVLDRLASRPATSRLSLGPLDDDAMTAWIGDRLPIESPLVARVVGLAGGNPMYASALVEHWIRIGALEDGPVGFRLRSGFDEGIPEGVRTVWRVRLDDVLRGDVAALHAFEIAAALGQMVDGAEWLRACALAGVALDRAAYELMLDAGLIAGEGDTRWSFVHPMLRDALLGGARHAGRLTGWHRACAAALGDRAPARRARHLVEAGEHADALAPLLAVAEHALERKQIAAAHRALVQRIRSLHALRRPRLDPDRVATRVRWSRLCRIRGSTQAAARHAGRAVAEAHALGDGRMYSVALLEQGRALGTVQGPAAGLPAVRAAAQEAAAIGDGQLQSRALLIEGGMLLASGRPRAAEVAYESALALAGAHEPLVEANVLACIADLARRGDDQDRAARCATRARALYQQIGARWGQAHASNLLGDIARYGGELDTAERCYRESCRLYGGIGSFDAIAADGNLALVLIETERYDEARRLLEHVVLRADGAHSHELSQIFRACLLPCRAADRDWRAWDATFGRITALRTAALVEPDVARTARRAAELALTAGEPARAAQACDLAIAQLDGLGRGDDADALRAWRATHCA
ncbi:MAG: protein kinase [Myxococcales bacterium]|nr:protein kinase [Myxococcales bacterium]